MSNLNEPEAVAKYLLNVGGPYDAPEGLSVIKVCYHDCDAMIVYEDNTVILVGKYLSTHDPIGGVIAGYNIYADDVALLLHEAGLVTQKDIDDWLEWWNDARKQYYKDAELNELHRLAAKLGKKVE